MGAPHPNSMLHPLHALARGTRPSGRLLVSVPNLTSVQNRLLRLLGRRPTSTRITAPHVRGYAWKRRTDFLRVSIKGTSWRWGALSAIVCVVSAACDPCAGVAECTREPAAVLDGRIINFPAQAGAGRVRIRVSAAGVQQETWTDVDGFWRIELPVPDEPGSVIARAEVTAPGATEPYVIDSLRVPVSRRRGEALHVGRWYDVPQLRFVGEVRLRPGISLGGMTVQVDRVGGVGGQFSSLVASVGRDRRFLVEGPATGLGPMLVRVSFRVPGFTEPFVHDSMSVLTMVRDTAANVQGTYSIGPAFLYRMRFLRDDTFEGIPRATVIFRRRSGPRLVSDSVTTVTDAEGFASPPVRPLERGVVVGDLSIIWRGKVWTSLRVKYPTVDDDKARFGGTFLIGALADEGARITSLVTVYRRTSFQLLAGAPWRFTPESGPLKTALSGVTDSRGGVILRASVGDTGTVRGTLAVRFASDEPEELLPGVTLPAVNDDLMRYVAYLGVGPSALYAGKLLDSVSRAPIPGATVEFRRRGGVPTASDSFSWELNELGLFRMFPVPLADGEIVGDLTFRLPAPYRDTTFTDIRLPTFRGDETRVGPVFLVRRP